jgi:glutamate synthase (NADPH/NADH) small chain
MSCARVCPVEVLCVGKCVYKDMGVPPIQIGKLQRYATDLAFDRGWHDFAAGPDTGKRVALIGAGPATLAAAHELRRLGHACTIFEKRPVLGGLNTTGVAPYKMRADRSTEEVEWILQIGGIEVRTNAEIGTAIAWADIERDYDAIFIGVGLGPDTDLGVPGETLPGVHGAVEFIERLKLQEVTLAGTERAVVIGGGNTAIDSVRELLGLGVASVTMMYRGVEAKMSGYQHEWSAAKNEGAAAIWRAQPLGFVGSERVAAVRSVRLDDGKRPVPGSEFQTPADLVLVAIGQSKLGELVAGLDGVAVDRGRIVVDAHQATGRAGVFAGGDCANGGKEVVNAAAEGKRAAQTIHSYLAR